ncbi:MAG: hypothetical protein OXT67_01680 [Zetaproteobacteria bacterium]|nr:hypothetical protein [Zetaproteobacteria bacterium]
MRLFLHLCLTLASIFPLTSTQANTNVTKVYMVETEMPFNLHYLRVHHRGLRFTDSRGERGVEFHFSSDKGVERYEIGKYKRAYVGNPKELGNCPYSLEQCVEACKNYSRWARELSEIERRYQPKAPDFVPSWMVGLLSAVSASAQSSSSRSNAHPEEQPGQASGYRLFHRDCWHMTQQVANDLGLYHACLERPVAVTKTPPPASKTREPRD